MNTADNTTTAPVTLEEWSKDQRDSATLRASKAKVRAIGDRATARTYAQQFGAVPARIAKQAERSAKSLVKATATAEATATATATALWLGATDATQKAIEKDRAKLSDLLALKGAPEALKPFTARNRAQRRAVDAFTKDTGLVGLFTGADRAMFGATPEGDLVAVAKSTKGVFTLVK